MKKVLSLLLYAVMSAVLSFSLLCCLLTSFDMTAGLLPCAAATLFAVLIMLALAAVCKKPRSLAVSVAVTAVIFAAVVFFTAADAVSQLNYAVNRVLYYYSLSFPLPSTVTFAARSVTQATYLFALLGFVLGCVTSLTLYKGRLAPLLISALLVLVPCFVMVDTLPDLLPLAVCVAIIASVYITAFVRRHNSAAGAALTLPVTAGVLALIIAAGSVFPQESFERFEWQDDALGYLENLTGIATSYGGTGSSRVSLSVDDRVKLTNLGELRQVNQKKLTVQSGRSGRLYLKAIAYANFRDNGWSILTDAQKSGYTYYANSFVTPDELIYDSSTVEITTEDNEDVVYVPYFSTLLPEGAQPEEDVLVRNQKGMKNYSFSTLNITEVPDSDASYASAHEQFIYSNYTDIPEKTRTGMTDIIASSPELLNALDSGSTSQIAAAVKDFVSKDGSYSTRAVNIPDGEDFPVWFLTNSQKKGYCVHYATAAAVLLRAMGVPARYAAGYCTTVIANTSINVSSNNAHAWAEYYDSNLGWVVLDATPVGFIPQGEPAEKSDVQPTAAVRDDSPSLPDSQPSAERPEKTDEKPFVPPAFLLPLAIALIIAAALVLRVPATRALRRRRLESGSLNSRAVYAYRYIEKIGRFAHILVPEEIENIALKARFGKTRVSHEELKKICGFAIDCRANALESSSGLKRFFLKYVIML